MNIMRGTFRISIVAALLTAAITAYQQWIQYTDTQYRRSQLQVGYECGAKKLEEIEASHTGYGNIDISKYGCASRPFWASLDELRSVRRGERIFDDFPVRFSSDVVINQAIAAFIVVNLLGMLFLAVRATVRWIAQGFTVKKP